MLMDIIYFLDDNSVIFHSIGIAFMIAGLALGIFGLLKRGRS